MNPIPYPIGTYPSGQHLYGGGAPPPTRRYPPTVYHPPQVMPCAGPYCPSASGGVPVQNLPYQSFIAQGLKYGAPNQPGTPHFNLPGASPGYHGTAYQPPAANYGAPPAGAPSFPNAYGAQGVQSNNLGPAQFGLPAGVAAPPGTVQVSYLPTTFSAPPGQVQQTPQPTFGFVPAGQAPSGNNPKIVMGPSGALMYEFGPGAYG